MSDIKARIVVDEDWKARVQRERETARRQPQSAQTPAASPSPETPEREAAPAPSAPQPESAVEEGVHPAFEALVGTLATQAMYCLGFMGAPGQTQVVVNLEQAKEAIDMALMLRDKTRGNLSAEENAVLNETLMELQRLFTARMQQAQAQAMQQAGIDPSQLRGQPPH